MRALLLLLLIAGVFAADADDPDDTSTLPLVQLLELKFDSETYRAVAARGPQVFDELVALLGEAQEERLSRILGSLGALAAKHEELLPKIIPILRKACTTPGYWWMSGVHDATGALEERAAPLVPDLIRQLERQEDDGLNPVFWSLYEIGEPALPAAERLIRFFGGTNEKMAIRVLAKLGPGIEPALRGALDRHPLAVLRVIVDLKRPTSDLLNVIRPLLTHDDATMRELAVEIWCGLGPADLVAVVKTAAMDPANQVRLAATKYLGHLPDQDAGPIVLTLLAADDTDVVADALWHVGSVGLPRASTCAQVLPFLGSKDPKVRRCAVRALGQLGSGLHGGAGFTDRVDDPADAELRTRIIKALRPLLTDPQAEVIRETITTLGTLGLADQEFRRWLLDHLADQELEWSCANVLRAIGLTAREVPLLLALLNDPLAKRRQMAVHIARELAPPERRVTDAVIACLSDTDAGVRGYAAVTLGELGPEAAHAYDALVKALDDSDRNTTGWAAQSLGQLGDGVIGHLRRDLRSGRHPMAFVRALGMREAAAAAAIPDVIAVLGTSDGELRTACIAALGAIGNGNAAARSAVQPFLGHADEEVSIAAIFALNTIGVDEPCARAMAGLSLPPSNYAHGAILEALLPWPDLLVGFLDRHPAALHDSVIDDAVAGWRPAAPAVRDMILRRPDVSLELRALSGDTTHLPTVRAAKEKAQGYGSSHLAAYARMLGDPPDTVVRISATQAGDFRPSSAWPRVDRRRMKPKADGHGDGFTKIIVTGVVRLPDGSHPKAIRFTGLNDRMLLGKREEREEKRVLYDPATGRFALFSTVFAAYSSGEGKAEEPGPYQTGSLTTRLIADGAKTLRVVFYDEMPDVEITVDPVK